MARRPIPSVDRDFMDVWAFLRGHRVTPTSPSQALIGLARRVHRATYALILWRFRLGQMPPHRRVFIEEIASDALQILPQAVTGYGKTTRLLMRGIIENALRHVYFSDHPIEFARMNRERKFYINTEQLLDYALIHPAIIESETRFDAVQKLRTLYHELSASVHGRGVRDLEMRKALKKIAVDVAQFGLQVKLVERCAEATNFLLATFHKTEMRRFLLEDRQIILRTMSPRARQVWSHLS